jgi:enoyl-CoA hydratase/carnithine racemase
VSIAAAALELLLDATDGIDVEQALVVESATYSLLQAGPEHRAWLAGRTRRAPRVDEDDPVLMVRDGTTLRLTLNRPAVRNAFNAAMREALLDALDIANVDTTIEQVVIDGRGPNFCSGGDLDEFGTLADPASAHLLRVERSVGRAVHRLRDRTTFVVHGACVGAGVELAAFAGRVVARPDATFRLPEIRMGLVPGAGGTVSLPRRIGRERTAWLALTGETIDATNALGWGLVDEIQSF